MKKEITICFLLFITGMAKAQYSTAIGVRGGETSGLTVKHFFGGSNAIEGIFGYSYTGFAITALFEHHQELGSGFSLYYGAGGHVTFGTDRRFWYHRNRGAKYYYDHYYYDGTVGLGIDGVIGLEYKIPKAPIAFSFDLKPNVEFGRYNGAWTSLDPGLGIKVAF